MELTRKQVIEILEKADSTVYKEPKTKTAQALEYAINSLKTDEAYQLMYEGEEIYTKDDVVAMLTELKNKFIDKSWNIDMYDDDLDFECCYFNDIDEIIQKKIKKLEEADNEQES